MRPSFSLAKSSPTQMLGKCLKALQSHFGHAKTPAQSSAAVLPLSGVRCFVCNRKRGKGDRVWGFSKTGNMTPATFYPYCVYWCTTEIKLPTLLIESGSFHCILKSILFKKSNAPQSSKREKHSWMHQLKFSMASI